MFSMPTLGFSLEKSISSEISIAIGIFFAIFIVVVALKAILSWHHKIDRSQALVIAGVNGKVDVSLTSAFVIPVFNRAEIMDLSIKTLTIERMAEKGVSCKDNIRADIKIVFFVRVNPTIENIRNVAQSIGCKNASEPKILQMLFESGFKQALCEVARSFDFEYIFDHKQKFLDEIRAKIGNELKGYKLEDMKLEYFEQTPIEHYNENNILDAQGLKKIIQTTTGLKMEANRILRESEITIKRQDIAAREAQFEEERQIELLQEERKRQHENALDKMQTDWVIKK